MKLNRAAVIASVPAEWTLESDPYLVTYKLGSAEVHHEFSGSDLCRILYYVDGELHRDPADGPAFTWFTGANEIYEKYFFNGEPVKNPSGHYGTMKAKDGKLIIAY